MDRTAIDAIQELALNNDRVFTSKGGIAFRLVSKNFNLESLERFDANPSRHRAHYTTNSLPEFIKYTEQELNNSSKIYIDADNMEALAIFDHGSHEIPMWGEQKASLTLKKMTPFDALMRNHNNPFSQKNFIDFLIDWGPYITFFHHEESVDTTSALQAIRNVTVKNHQNQTHTEEHYKSEKSAFESVEMSASNNNMPTHFDFATIPYEGFERKNIQARIIIQPNSEQVIFKYRIEQKESLEFNLAHEFRLLMSRDIDESMIHLGVIKHQ